MLAKLRHARLLWPTLATVAALSVLVGLGTWQLERKRWKEDLLAKIATRVTAAPVPLTRVLAMMNSGADVEYVHVLAHGRYLHDKERYLYAPAPGGQAWHVYTPLQIENGSLIWVNRGLVPDADKDQSRRMRGQIAGETEVRGLIRVPMAKDLFTPENNAQGNLWYWPDLAAMTASAFPAGTMALPFAIDADAEPAPPGGLPKGGATRISLPNRHLEYAVTWYGLAATLIGVYLAFAIPRIRADSGD